MSAVLAPLPAFELDRPDLSRWRSGNTGTTGVWRFTAGIPGLRVALTALIHGNELCGAWAAAGLLESLHGGSALQCGELTVAFCNLDAFDRFDPKQPDASRFVEEDLNRQWSAERLASGSTVERRRAAELLPWLQDADALLDLHSMHEQGSPLLLAGPLVRNGEFARELGLGGHVVVDAGHADGTRLRDSGRFGDPEGSARSLLIECGYHGDPASRRVAQDAVYRLMTSTGLVSPSSLPTHWRLDQAGAKWALEVTDAVVARSMSFQFARCFEDLECLPTRGTVIAHDQDTTIATPYDNCVLVMPSLRQLRPGVTVVRFARRTELC
jgi:predicted deacylase